MFYPTTPIPSGVPDYEQCWADTDSTFQVPGDARPWQKMCTERGTTVIGLCPYHHVEILGVESADNPKAQALSV